MSPLHAFYWKGKEKCASTHFSSQSHNEMFGHLLVVKTTLAGLKGTLSPLVLLYGLLLVPFGLLGSTVPQCSLAHEHIINVIVIVESLWVHHCCLLKHGILVISCCSLLLLKLRMDGWMSIYIILSHGMRKTLFICFHPLTSFLSPNHPSFSFSSIFSHSLLLLTLLSSPLPSSLSSLTSPTSPSFHFLLHLHFYLLPSLIFTFISTTVFSLPFSPHLLSLTLSLLLSLFLPCS